jgi:acetyl-CoA carboxylase biotin carboxyl carrier protein
MRSLPDPLDGSKRRKEAPVADDSNRQVDLRTLKVLAALMTEHDLSFLDVRDGSLHIRLRRGQTVRGLAAAPVALTTPAPVSAAPPATAPAARPAEPTVSDKPTRKLHEIKSPTPGPFYAQEKPGSPPYVKVGDRVQPSSVVCQIEAMKIFNEITADCSGTIVEVCVENKQPVEYGQVLFRVDPGA